MNENGATATPELVELADLDLLQLWKDWRASVAAGDAYYSIHTERRTFVAAIGNLVSNPECVDEIVWCAMCTLPRLVRDGENLDDGHWACDVCLPSCTVCEHCEGRFAFTTTTIDYFEICEGCRDENYFYCEDCDVWAHNDNESDHRHDGCDCPVFGTTFAIRNGGGLLANDTETEVTLPGGVISDEGIGAISSYVRYDSLRDDGDLNPELTRLLSFELPELGTSWQTRQGNYTKRFSQLAYKKHQMKIAPQVLSRVGDIARDHSKPVDLRVAVTRELNMGPEEFYNDDSCWWQSYTASRCALKSNGGFALRTFGPDGEVYGRAWVLPFRYDQSTIPQFETTFETVEADAFIVFNGYGDLGGYAPARLLAHMVGMTYRKIAFTCDPMYINAGGYLVAPEAIAHPYTDGGIGLIVPQHADLYENEKVTTHA
jgi:hypothetical protein